MGTAGVAGAKTPSVWQYLALIAACVMLAATLAACGGEDSDAADRTLALEAKVHALEETVERLEERLAAAESAATDSDGRRDGDSGAVAPAAFAQLESSVAEALAQVEELAAEVESDAAAIEEIEDALHDIGQAIEGLEAAAGEIAELIEFGYFDLDRRIKELNGGEDNAVEDTANLAKEAGADVRIIGSERPAVLALPYPFPEKALPLIVSLHGFGGNSYWQSQYVPLHERVNAGHFALLLPNGTVNADGERFWNPTDLLSAKGEPPPTTWPICPRWWKRPDGRSPSGRCTSSATPTADSCRTGWPARGCPGCAPSPALPEPATLTMPPAKARPRCRYCTSTAPTTR